MRDNRDSKKIAKSLLNKNFSNVAVAFAAVCLFILLFAVVMLTVRGFLKGTIIHEYFLPFSSIFLLLFSPVFNGFFKVVFCLVKNSSTKAGYVFYYFSSIDRYFDAFTLNIFLVLRLIIVFFIAVIPFLAFEYSLELFLPDFSEVYASLISNVLLSVMLTAAFLFILRYFLVYFFYENDSNQNISFYFKSSAKVMKLEKIVKFIFMFFSFLPWFLLCFFVLPAFYIFPYFCAATCIFGFKSIQSNK